MNILNIANLSKMSISWDSMIRKIVIFACFVFAFLLLVPKDAYAKRLLPRAAPVKSAVRATGVVRSRGVNVSVRFRGDRRAINVTFSNLGIAKSVSYQLIYTSRGVKEGARGIVSEKVGSATRELLFGTCSKGVCRYHTGITNAKFTVTTTLKNGRKVVKPFRLKV